MGATKKEDKHWTWVLNQAALFTDYNAGQTTASEAAVANLLWPLLW